MAYGEKRACEGPHSAYSDPSRWKSCDRMDAEGPWHPVPPQLKTVRLR